MSEIAYPFIGRKAEISLFLEMLENKTNVINGRIVLVKGNPAFGKTMLLNKMMIVAEHSVTLKCICLRYETTPTDGTDSLMLEIVNDIVEVTTYLGKGIRKQLNANKEKIKALFSAGGLIPLVGSQIKEFGGLLLTLVEDAKKKGNIRQSLKGALNLISQKLPIDGRLIIFIDPEKYLQNGSADTWRLLVKDLPDKIIFVFAQRPEDQLIIDFNFTKLDNVVRIPQGELNVFSEQDIEDLLDSRRSELSNKIGESELRSVLNSYQGHPYSTQAALNLLSEGIAPESLPRHSEPVDFANMQIQKIEEKGPEAISLFEACAVLEVASDIGIICKIASINHKTLRMLLSDPFLKGMLRQEVNGIKIYHIILADEILNKANIQDVKTYNQRAVKIYRTMLEEAKKNNIRPKEIVVLRLPIHVLEAEGELAFARCFNNECEHYFQWFGLLEEYIKYSKQALTYTENDPECSVALLSNLGNFYCNQGDTEKAEQMFQKSLQIHRQYEDIEGMAVCHGNLGNVYYYRGESKKAEQAYQKALEYETSLDNLEGMARNYGNLAVIYHCNRNLEEAEKMLINAIQINEKLENMISLAYNYGNLANLYADYGKVEQSDEMYRKALEIETKLGHIEGMARNYGNLGNRFTERGDFKQAEEMYRKALDLNTQLNFAEGIAYNYLNFGVLYKKQGNQPIAVEYWEKALKLFNTIGNTQMVQRIKWLMRLRNPYY